MADKNWKRFERKIAAYYGTTRALMKGTGQKKDIGPEDDFPLMLDCKLRKYRDWRVMVWFEKLEDAIIGEVHAKWPVLCLKEPGKAIEYAVVRQAPLMQFITQKAKTLPPDTFIIRDGGSLTKSSVVTEWKVICKRVKDLKLSDDVIPMLELYDKKRYLNMLILSPKDHARILYAGGLLKEDTP